MRGKESSWEPSFQMVISWFLVSTGIQTRKTVFFGKRRASLSLFPSLSLSLTPWRTHTVFMHTAHPPLLSLISKLKRPPSPQTQTHCANGVRAVRALQKGKKFPQRQTKSRRKTRRLCGPPLYQKTNDNLTVPLGLFLSLAMFHVWVGWCTTLQTVEHMVGSAHWTEWSANTHINS